MLFSNVIRVKAEGKEGAMITELYTLLALFTPIGPVEMYMLIKLADLVKIIFSYFWLKKERWLHCLAQPGME